MKASDVMSSNVITVDADTCVQDVADTLLQNRISAVPVVDRNGKLLGIVSESDLMRRPEAGTEKQPSPWLELLSSKQALADDFVRTHSRKVVDVMTKDVITATPDTPVGEIARLLEKNSIKRVPIMDGKKVVGIVSRANLLQALASLKSGKAPKTTPADATIRQQLIAELNKQSWTRPSMLNVTVQDGNVDLWGVVDSQAERKAVRVLAEVTPGVRAVNDNLIVHPMVYGGPDRGLAYSST
jgi:CBS domain-containing protein